MADESKRVDWKRKRRDPREYSEVLRGLKPVRHALSDFIPWPNRYCVEVQHEEEQILLLIRQHWLTNLRWIVITIGLLLGGWLITQLPFYSLLPGNFQLMTEVLWYLICLAVVLEGFFGWYFDVFVITDERIIDIDFLHLVYKNITATKIENIEDVTYNVSGAVHSLFNFGSVLVQTAGTGVKMVPDETSGTLEFWDTPKPAMVAKLINEMILEEEREQLEGRVR